MFKLGQLVATTGVVESISPEDVSKAIARHVSGDWGNVCPEGKETNDEAVKYGNRIMSVYSSSNDIDFWVITEADRSSTTVLLPEEY